VLGKRNGGTGVFWLEKDEIRHNVESAQNTPGVFRRFYKSGKKDIQKIPLSRGLSLKSKQISSLFPLQ
jgi:hypothetical protein